MKKFHNLGAWSGSKLFAKVLLKMVKVGMVFGKVN